MSGAFFAPVSPPQLIDQATLGNLLARVRALEAVVGSGGGGEGIQFFMPIHYGQDYNLGESLDVETTNDMDFFAGDGMGTGHVDWSVGAYFNVTAYSGIDLKANGDGSGIVLEVLDVGDLSLLTNTGDIHLNPGGFFVIASIPTVNPGGSGRVWSSGGALQIT